MIAYDRPGFGRSSLREARDLRSDVADVCALLDALGVGRVQVLAFFGGAAVAYALAIFAMLQGPANWVAEARLLRIDSGFHVSEVRCPVTLWHGTLDDVAATAVHQERSATTIRNRTIRSTCIIII